MLTPISISSIESLPSTLTMKAKKVKSPKGHNHKAPYKQSKHLKK